jgi:uncharacterized protein (DUF1800 family)
VERVLEMGIFAYIDAQLDPGTIPEIPELERRLSDFETLMMSSAELFREYPPPGRVRREMQMSGEDVDTAALRMAGRKSYQPLGELSQARLARAVYSERQLQEVMVDFWLNHFNVYARKGPVRLFLPEYEREVIRAHALGDFRQLLGEVAKSPAMLFYLDNWMSAAADSAPRAGSLRRGTRRGGERGGPGAWSIRGLNENYARELLELHTLGVDGGYTQSDVMEVARAFTGWTIDLRRGEFSFVPMMHDAGPKVVLGHEIPGGEGQVDGEKVLDLLAQHPSAAHFITEKLVRRFVSDEPPQALVERAAETFLETNGDIREVVRTIVTSPEFFSREAYRAKVKTPLEWMASSARGLDVQTGNLRPLLGALNRLDQPLYGAQPPTGYPDVAEAWVSSGALLMRAELSQRIAAAITRGRPGRELAAGGDAAGATLGRLLPEVENDHLRAVMEMTVEDIAEPRRRLETVVSLALASPEFQRK